MSDSQFADVQLLAYLDEMLPVEEMTAVERALRSSDSLRARAAGLARRRDQGAHSVGEIWRRLRLSCPSRSQLGGFLLGTLDPAFAEYVDFHLRTVGCRYCAANLADLEQSRAAETAASSRRRKFFESSAGYLSRRDG
jgi:anti-sigma factor RsiW